jgi:phenylpyruvate tautomerase PptA (4-oxalocrotonate tautomerase family)
MPIIDIEVVARRGEVLPETLARELADHLGAAFDATPGKVWVRLRTLDGAQYAENDMGDNRPFPVFVTYTASQIPEGEQLAGRIAKITETVARLTERPPGNVHVLIAPAARGRIAFGGRLVK